MFDDLLEGVGGTTGRLIAIGLAIGAGLLLGRGLRPVAKGMIRGYLTVADRVKEMVAETGESLQDIYAEAKAEYEQEEATQPQPSIGSS